MCVRSFPLALLVLLSVNCARLNGVKQAKDQGIERPADGLLDAAGDQQMDLVADAMVDAMVDATVDATIDSSADRGIRKDSSPDSFPSQLTPLPTLLKARTQHAGVWTGSEFIVWGGRQDIHDQCEYGSGSYPQLDDGARFAFDGKGWRALPSVNAPSRRMDPPTVWTGTEMLTWGACVFWEQGLGDGAAYDPAKDSWRTLSTTSAPIARGDHTAVWTGARLVVWGGHEGDLNLCYNTGAAYDPVGDSWQALPTAGAPSGRHHHSAVWTGTQMIVWGGQFNWNADSNTDTGGVFTPGASFSSGSWKATSTSGAPSKRTWHSATWTGTEMIIWGGRSQSGARSGGGAYDPTTDSWRTLSSVGAPPASYRHAALWTGKELLIIGGCCSPPTHYHSYDPTTDTWKQSVITSALFQRYGMAAAWTGKGFIFYGGAKPPGKSDLLADGAFVPHAP
jgi:hypothetical protein